MPFLSREPAPAVSGPSYAAPSACHYPGANSPGFPSLLHISTVLLQSKVWREALCRGGLGTVQLRRWHQRSHSSQGLICCCSHKPALDPTESTPVCVEQEQPFRKTTEEQSRCRGAAHPHPLVSGCAVS